MPPVWPHEPRNGPTHILTGAVLVEDVKEVLQRGNGEGGVQAFRCMSKAAVEGADWQKSTLVVPRPANARPPRKPPVRCKKSDS